MQLKKKFGNIRQKSGVSIGEFKKEFDEYYDVLLGAGVAATPQPELAMLFLDKLDPQRYASMLAQLTNDATLGRAFPQTLHAAWSIASGWKSANTKIAGGSDMQSVFVLADDASVVPSRNPKAGREAGRCACAAGRGAGRSSQRDQTRQPSATTSTTSKPSGTSASTETRTCRGCFVKGHLYRNCPDNPDRADAKVLIASGEDDEADEDDVYESTAFLLDDGVAHNQAQTESNSTVFFSHTAVLLDNQA